MCCKLLFLVLLIRCLILYVQNGEAKLGPPIIMCTRSYPECSVYGEGGGADGECDMDSSTENASSSDSLDPTRHDRSVTAASEN